MPPLRSSLTPSAVIDGAGDPLDPGSRPSGTVVDDRSNRSFQEGGRLTGRRPARDADAAVRQYVRVDEAQDHGQPAAVFSVDQPAWLKLVRREVPG